MACSGEPPAAKEPQPPKSLQALTASNREQLPQGAPSRPPADTLPTRCRHAAWSPLERRPAASRHRHADALPTRCRPSACPPAPSRHRHDTANGTPCGTANGTANGTAKPPATRLLRAVRDTANDTDRGTDHDTDRGTHFYIKNNNKIQFASRRATRGLRAHTHTHAHARTRHGLRPRCARPAAEQPTATRKPPLQPQNA